MAAHQHHSDTLPPYTQEPRPPKIGPIPFWMIALALIGVVGTWLPLVILARARAATSPLPRVQLMQDMGMQPKYREQQSSEVFADGRADRPKIEGTVARGQLHSDDHFDRGYEMVADEKTGKDAPKFFEDFPKQVKVDAKLLARGQERFNIYCSVCHGLDGQGNGAVNQIALQMQLEDPPRAHWTQVADLTSDVVKARPVGHIFNTINVGIRNMGPYGDRIAPADRWAIVSYVRALQQSRNVRGSELPDDIKTRIDNAAKSK